MDEKNPPAKFQVKADLVLFEALQKNGKLSEEGLSQQTGIAATTAHYALKRIHEREFFEVKAVPNLSKFPEIPMAILGFAHVHPIKVRQLIQRYVKKPEMVQLFHTDKDVFLLVMETDAEALTMRLFEIMEILEEKPSLYMKSPTVAKFEPAIPDKVLEAVYPDLPDRRFSV